MAEKGERSRVKRSKYGVLFKGRRESVWGYGYGGVGDDWGVRGGRRGLGSVFWPHYSRYGLSYPCCGMASWCRFCELFSGAFGERRPTPTQQMQAYSHDAVIRPNSPFPSA